MLLSTNMIRVRDVIKDVPAQLYFDGLTYMAKVGYYLIGRFEYYEKNQ